MKHVEIKFNSDNTNECRNLKLNNEQIAEAVANYKSRKKYINTSFDGDFEVGGNWYKPYVIVKAGTIISLDVEDLESLKDELTDFDNDDIEVNVKDFTNDEELMLKEIEALKEETEKINRKTKRIQKLQEEFAQARIAKEKAAEKLAEAIATLKHEEELLANAKLEQKEIEEKGLNDLFTVKEMKQDNGRTHYFVAFTKKVSRETYKKLEAFAYLNNGKYRSENNEKGFYFKSSRSKDSFMNIESLEMSEEMKEKIAKRERFVALNYKF